MPKLVGIVLYMLVLVAIGWVASSRVRDARDFFAAGKRLGFLAVAFSARATGESAWLLLGLTGMGAALGVHAFWVVLGEVLGVSAAWLLMSRRFKRLTDRYDSITFTRQKCFGAAQDAFLVWVCLNVREFLGGRNGESLHNARVH